ncbi:MAG: N-acetylmuramoyl-L-alanine amidase [Candidatus Glassbacteria bacterium]|nr:N-acetylmuramoyl-L-alanine amidase [Candidatus Glassbacteria bacterium]
MSRILTVRLTLIAVAVLSCRLPLRLAAGEFEVQFRSSGRTVKLELIEAGAVSCLDLGALAGLVGGELRWEIPAERITWTVEGVPLRFEDRLSFFTSAGKSFQLVGCCLVDRGRFLVPAQLAVEFLPGFFPERFAFNKLENRLVDKSAGSPAARPVKPGAGTPTTDPSDFRINTVVIDPGHGGKDPGALGRKYKLQEKDVVLDISRKVAGILNKKSKLKVLLTRDSDEYIYFERRGKIANESGAGLFVSIHANASKKSSICGTSTFFLDAAKTDEDRATAMLENASLKYEVEQIDTERLDEVNLILQDMAQNEYLRESYELSTCIHQQLVGLLKIPAWGRGVRQANFAVLRGAFMPAALVEVAFISNAAEEKLLRSKKFREKAAEAIAAGILAYIERYHKKLVSGS